MALTGAKLCSESSLFLLQGFLCPVLSDFTLPGSYLSVVYETHPYSHVNDPNVPSANVKFAERG